MSVETPDATRREALLDQLGYLVAEAEALVPLLARLPADYLGASLPGERSVLATLAHLAALDREVYADRLRRIVSEDDPAFESADPDGTVHDTLGPALADVAAGRRALLDAFGRLAPADWLRIATFPDGERLDVVGFALQIVHRDAAELRRLAYRMHESHLTERAVDLPK